MSAEAIEPEVSDKVIELYGAEALVRLRIMLHNRLGDISVRLNDAYVEKNDCISQIIKLDEALRAAGVDTDELAKQLYAAPPDD